MGKGTALQIARLKIDGFNDNRPRAVPALMLRVTRRTSLKVALEVPTVAPTDPKLFSYPLVILTGDQGFAPLSEEAILRLRAYLTSGGLLWIDASDGNKDGEFDRSARRLIKRVFPQRPIEKLSKEHTIYRSFYLTHRLGGRILQHPFVEGVTLDDRTVLLYSMNDLHGAFERDPFGNWTHPVVPGGEMQREHAFRLGINIVMYAVCVNYKQDLVHVPAIMRRRR